MSYRAKVWYFLLCSAMIIALLPLLNFDKFIIKYDWKELFVTDRVESYVNYAAYKLMNISLDPDSVVAGEDGFLFLGNKHANILHKTRGVFRPELNKVNKWVGEIKKLQQWYEGRGIKFVMVVAPNKHSIYADKLPAWSPSVFPNITDDVVSVAKKLDVNFLDLRPKLIGSKDRNEILYYKKGSHWNALGASIGYEKTIDFINAEYKLNLNKSKYSIVDGDKGRDRTLLKMLKFSRFFANDFDNEYVFEFLKNNTVCHGNINKETGKLKACVEKNNPIMSTNHQPQYMVNNASQNKHKLLLICDSFGSAHSQIYNDTFRTIWKWHYSHMNGNFMADFVRKNKPDIVIYQLVERALPNKKVTRLPAVIYPFTDIDDRYIGKNLFDIKVNRNGFNKNKKFKLLFNDDQVAIEVTHKDPLFVLNQTRTDSSMAVLDFKLTSEKRTSFRLYYKSFDNKKYHKDYSFKLPIKVGLNEFKLLIPSEFINNNLRVDPVAANGSYVINEFKLYEYNN